MAEWGICFEEVVVAIDAGEVLDALDHSDPQSSAPEHPSSICPRER